MTFDEWTKSTKKDLDNGEKPNIVLVNFYSSLFGFRRDIYGVVGKLINNHGALKVFYAIMDLYDSDKNPEKSLYIQLNKICMKYTQVSENESIAIDLNSYIREQVV